MADNNNIASSQPANSTPNPPNPQMNSMNPFSSAMTTVVNIKLDRTNYPLWLAQILPILRSCDLMYYTNIDILASNN
ncbi:unnamed protein product [Malus baccata var. baccata]